MSTDTDFSLEDLREKGITALQDAEAEPGTTYEVGPGLIGEMPWPTLADRDRAQEIRSELIDLFKNDATAEQFEALNRAAQGSEDLSEKDTPIREDVSIQEFTRTTARVNCELAAFLLDFDKDVQPSDIVPEMAAVVSTHFTRLRAGSTGPNGS